MERLFVTRSRPLHPPAGSPGLPVVSGVVGRGVILSVGAPPGPATPAMSFISLVGQLYRGALVFVADRNFHRHCANGAARPYAIAGRWSPAGNRGGAR